MSTAISPLRVTHMNIVVEDFDASVAYLQHVYDAEFVLDLPAPQWHAGLIETGQVLFELIAPVGYLTNARYGPHYVGIEYQADMAVARRAVAERGIRLVRDSGHAFHTHPEDCFGVAIEIYDGAFHNAEWPLLGGNRTKPAQWWRDEHPLGLLGLAGYTVVVRNAKAACAFFQSLLGATIIDAAERSTIAAHVIRVQVADSWIELLEPTGHGAILDHLNRYGQGIYSTVFGVCDRDRARDHLLGKGVQVVPGSAPHRIAVPAASSLGVIFEFDA